MIYKQNPNHRQYLITLEKTSAEQRLIKALEFSAITRELFITGLRKRFPQKTAAEKKYTCKDWLNVTTEIIKNSIGRSRLKPYRIYDNRFTLVEK